MGPPSNLWGPPRAPMRSLTSSDTLSPGLVLPPVQLGKFADFWGLPMCGVFLVIVNNNHHHVCREKGMAPMTKIPPIIMKFFRASFICISKYILTEEHDHETLS